MSRARDARRGAPCRAVVELAGPAGAGKTTLARALRDADPAIEVGLRPGRPGTVRGLAAAAPSLAAARLSAPGRSLSRDELRSLAYLSAWQAPAGSRHARGPTVLDHGPVFRLASLAAYGPPMAHTRVFSRRWHRLAAQWGRLLDVVVWLDAPDDVLLRRIDGRDQAHRIRGAARGEAEAFLARYRGAYRTTIAAVTAAGAGLVELDTAASSPAHLATTLRTAILESLSSRSA